MDETNIGDTIGQIVIDFYNNLPKTGKCQDFEWSVLSAIILEDEAHNYKVVSLGTGTKCLSEDKMDIHGCLVNDCHAEIIARRNFIYYLIKEVENAANNKTSIFKYDKEKQKYQLLPDLYFHMYISQSPCGEASLFEYKNAKRVATNIFESKQRNKRRQLDKLDIHDECNKDCTTQTIDNYINNKEHIHLTGAKIMNHKIQDTLLINSIPLRIKPGRGISTCSNCCSDKLALWSVIGIQGKMLSCLINPIYLSSITISSYYNYEALDRCFKNRLNVNLESINKNKIYSIHIPQYYHCSIIPSFSEESVIEHLQGNRKMSSCGSCISWNLYSNIEILSGSIGLKNGFSLKQLKSFTNLKGCSIISRHNLWNLFIHLWNQLSISKISLSLSNTINEQYELNNINNSYIVSQLQLNSNSQYNIIKNVKNKYSYLKEQLLDIEKTSPFYTWKRKDIQTFYSFT